MSDTVTIRPSHGHQRFHRLLTVVITIAVLIAATVAVVMFVAALRDDANPTPRLREVPAEIQCPNNGRVPTPC